MSLFERAQELKTEARSAFKDREPTHDEDQATPSSKGISSMESAKTSTEEIDLDGHSFSQKEPVSYAWLEVGAAAGMTDLTTDTLDHALFLFARHLVTSCPADEFMAMGHRYCPSWRRSLHEDAWAIVEEHIRVRLKQIGWKKEPNTQPTEGANA